MENGISEIEVKVRSAFAYGANSSGCKRFKSEIMLSFLVKPDSSSKSFFHDLFLSSEQAKLLVESINQALNTNEKSVVPRM